MNNCPITLDTFRHANRLRGTNVRDARARPIRCDSSISTNTYRCISSIVVIRSPGSLSVRITRTISEISVVAESKIIVARQIVHRAISSRPIRHPSGCKNDNAATPTTSGSSSNNLAKKCLMLTRLTTTTTANTPATPASPTAHRAGSDTVTTINNNAKEIFTPAGNRRTGPGGQGTACNTACIDPFYDLSSTPSSLALSTTATGDAFATSTRAAIHASANTTSVPTAPATDVLIASRETNATL